MTPDRATIEATIAALEAQRPLLGDAVVDVAVAPLRASLAATASVAAPNAPAPPPDAHGAAATARTAASQALRQVTIVFVDVVGSTSLSQRLDPEEQHALMDGTLAACTAIVASHDGRVLQYAGDGLLAVFGADRAREDDAERAVLAGLALLAEGRRRREAVRQAHGHAGFDLRVGAHTGGVLLGGGIDADGNIRGIAVNIAARMEQTAPPGTLRITRDTYRQVRGLFAFAPQPPLLVKGIDEPVVSYLVERAVPRSFVGSGRGLADADPAAPEVAALTGRDAEIAAVLGALHAAVQTRTLRLVTVVAEAGLGKSRLLLEVERRIAARPSPPRLLHGRAQRHGMNVPHGVIRDMLAWHCGIVDSDPADVACARLVAGFGAVFGDRAAEQAALVGQLIGLDFSNDPNVAGIVHDGAQIRARAFHALAQFVRILCASGEPVVVLLDDLHWADDGSLDLIRHLVASCGDLPFLIGCFARPALLERRPDWDADAAAAGLAVRVALQPFDDADSERLLDALLARLPEPPPALRSLVLRAAEGNPFHMEELLGMLIDDRVIMTGPDGWRVDAARLTAARVPPTLTAVLQARLDALPDAERVALQHDSIIGHVFWEGALRDLAPASVDALGPLLRRELILRRDGSAFAEMPEFAFKHHLLHQVTYETVLKSSRRALHGRVADWLVAHTGERIREHLGPIADHYQRAGNVAEAGRYLLRAAEAAYAAAAYGPALDYLERGLALAGDGDPGARLALLDVRMNVYNATGRRAGQAADLDMLERCAEALDDDRSRASVARWRALLAVVAGDYRAAVEAADRVSALVAPDAADPSALVGALLDKAQALIFLGDAATAESCLQSALALARRAGRSQFECSALNRLNGIAQDRGDFEVARRHLEEALVVARRTANRRFEGGLVGNLGQLEARLGNHDRARELLQAGLDICRAIGDRGSEPYCLLGLAGVARDVGDPRSALVVARQALAMATDAADRGLEIECLLCTGACCADVGDVDEAAACLDAAEAKVASADEGQFATALVAARAALALQRGRIDEAVDHARRLVERLSHRRAAGDRDDPRHYFVCHRVLKAAGDPGADALLALANERLRRQADALTEADRHSYLSAIAPHRAIVAAAAAADIGAGDVAGGIAAGDVGAGDIAAGDVGAGGIEAGAIGAAAVAAGHIEAGDRSAG